jgi:hypothetical protein
MTQGATLDIRLGDPVVSITYGMQGATVTTQAGTVFVV